MKPALTAVEWGQALAGNAPWMYRADNDTPEEYHAAGALYLYGQPFGFTREDAEAVRLCIRICDVWITREDTLALWQQNRPYVLSIADRIEALLPPVDA